MADGPPEGSQAEAMEEGLGLVTDSSGAVLKVAIIKTHSWINPDGLNPSGNRAINFCAEVIKKGGGVVGRVEKVTDFTDIFSLNVAKDDACLMVGDHAIDLGVGLGAGEVEDGGACFEATASDGRLIGFDGEQSSFLGEGGDDGEEGLDLLIGADASGVGEGGFGAEIDEVSSFGAKAAGAGESGLGTEANAFAVPGVGAEIYDAHEMRPVGGTERLTTKREFGHLGRQGGGILLGKFSEGFKREHGSLR